MKKLKTILRIIFTCILLYIIFSSSKVDLSSIRSIYSEINLIYLLPFFLFRYSSLLLLNLRLKYVLNIKNLNYSFWSLFKLLFVGRFYNLVLPTAYGGDAVKGYFLYKNNSNLEATSLSLITDRLIGLGTQFLIGFFILFSKKFRRYTTAFIVSLVGYILVIISDWLLSVALNLDINIIYFFLFTPLIHIVTTLPITIGGIGTREAGYIFLFTKIGITTNEVLSLSILIFTSHLIEALIGGTINLFGKFKLEEK